MIDFKTGEHLDLEARHWCFTGVEAIAIAGVALAAVGTAVSVYSAVQAGDAQADAARRQGEIDAQNATIAGQEATAAAQAQQRQAGLVLGAARAGYGASGVTGEGSALDVLSSSASNSELDRQNIIYQGQLKAAGYVNSANTADATASNAITGGYGKAGSSLLSGASSAFSKIPTGGTPNNELLGTAGVQSPQIDSSGNYSV